MPSQYYPHAALGLIVIAVIFIFGIIYFYRKYRSENFESMLDSVYKPPFQSTFDPDLNYNIDNLLVPTPNYDSSSWIDNNVSDYAYLREVDNVSIAPVGPQPVTDTANIVLKAPMDKRRQPIMQTQSDYYLLDDGDNGNLKFDYDRCSKSCCATNVWPTPFYNPDEETIPGKDYVPTNMFCSNSISNGCLCATPKQVTNLRTRGGNSPYFF